VKDTENSLGWELENGCLVASKGGGGAADKKESGRNSKSEIMALVDTRWRN